MKMNETWEAEGRRPVARDPPLVLRDNCISRIWSSLLLHLVMSRGKSKAIIGTYIVGL